MEVLAIILGTILLGCVALIVTLNRHNVKMCNAAKESEELAKELQSEVFNLQADLGKERESYSKILSQKKSSETRLGQISENLVPFLAGFKYDAKSSKFLGDPIDYIVFDLDQAEIVFLEVKTGNSRLTKKQKVIKNIIDQGRVRFEEFKINTKGIKVKST